MKENNKGPFALGIESLKIQINHLFEGFGGEAAIELLDFLSTFPPTVQKSYLQAFKRAAEKSLAEKNKLSEIEKSELTINFDIEGNALLELEQNLIEEIALEFNKQQSADKIKSENSTIAGINSAQTISFEEARKKRAQKLDKASV
ncbi:MAG TPA: hypothetical protein PKD37_08250 [Oligoflexia bacterium]|nr:hypothetical protein [Oligoflexia bacterium]HMP27954.1 hypothetical protein [Oligoflexia bacterium]